MEAFDVLVVEDDKTLAGAITSLLRRNKISAKVTGDVSEAKQVLTENPVKAVYIDCLLPSESGLDLARAFRQMKPNKELKIILMSGVFTDASFVKESLKDTGADSFLTKPFQNQEFLSFIDHLKSGGAGNAKKALYDFITARTKSHRDLRRMLESLDEIHGYELPMLYSVIVNSSMTGHLNMVSQSGEVSGVSFCEGVIVAVDMADKETMLGRLLIAAGYILPADLESVIHIKSSQKLGEKLIANNLLSPHGFFEVLSQQMSIRLSRTIVNENIKVNFSPADLTQTKPFIDGEQFRQYFHDWVGSKIPADWLRAYFAPWLADSFTKLDQFDDKEFVQSQILATVLGPVQEILGGARLKETLDKNAETAEFILRGLYYLLMSGQISPKVSVKYEAEEKFDYLMGLRAQFIGKSEVDVFDTLVRMTNTQDSKPELVYQEYLNLLGDEPPAQDKKVHTLFLELKKWGDAYLESQKKVDHQIQTAKAKSAELQSSGLNKVLEARQQLDKGMYKEALVTLLAIKAEVPMLRLYILWARLASSQLLTPDLKTIVEHDFLKVPPEDKFESIFYLVTGLYQRLKGDFNAARKSLEKAVAIDSALQAARKELTQLSKLEALKKDQVSSSAGGDLRSFIGSIFNRK